MQTITIKNRTYSLSFFKTLVLGLVLALGIVSCGGGGNNTPVPPAPTVATANGLFTGMGTVNGATSLTDVRGFVHEGRFIIFDETEAVLYDGQISTVTGSDLIATLDVYKDGAKVNTAPVAVTGTVVGQSSIYLVLNGTGYALGTLTLTFDPQYNRGATIARLVAESPLRWVGDGHTPTTSISGNVRLRSSSDVNDNTFEGTTSAPSQCDYEGTKSIPDPSINIYLIDSLEVLEIGACDHISTGHTGFFAVVDGAGLDDTLLFAVTNGTYSNFSVMTRQ